MGGGSRPNALPLLLSSPETANLAEIGCTCLLLLVMKVRAPFVLARA
jgi:hypothetical protein